MSNCILLNNIEQTNEDSLKSFRVRPRIKNLRSKSKPSGSGVPATSASISTTSERTLSTSTSSPQVQDSRRHDINVRTQLAGHLTGIRHAGLKRICAALNLPPPLEEGRHNKHDKELLQVVRKFANESMSTAMQEAIDVAKSTDITVSGDGTWQTRRFSSKHGAADLLSTCDSPKVVDIETCSKTCNVCTGAKSLLQLGTPEARAKYDQIIINHNCGKNFYEPSGNMEASCILRMFRRSQKKYGVRYVKYVGDGDSKTFSKLKKETPYKGIEIQKIEDINHFGKHLKRALEKIKRQCDKTMLSDGKRIGGKGRLTTIKDTTDEETPNVSDADDVSETSDQQNEKKNNDDESGHGEDLYYNPKSGKWTDSDDDN
ncbi:unnamed protein product [Rotaria sordida]|uniref:Mutator-like transposase domain-containing protein n=1 Tax=Rotaria sordida TaxID=392033 RepID=A0A814UR03_9BILA|nr:unnamed protein product [Rotaria sordida]CAF1438385.1 unnamed protein product [Rotaria sordida]